MLSANDLKSKIDLHDLAAKLGWKKDKATGNYSSPNRPDKNPSVSIFNGQSHQIFKDHTSGEGGSCIDMVIYSQAANDVAGAIKELHNIYNFPTGNELQPRQQRELTDVERWACGCLKNPSGCKPYLMNERKIGEAVINT